ncbi:MULTISPECIES: STAS domain-containing protein [Mycobacterium]|jgi:anti-anti-sigma factor|uniref:STAS domain-containing protein n=1 Tax=Mycobacterium TaxID=1763 RepID=UPI000A16B65F|nr:MULTISPECIES: STAS domain-containing protein [Mycobacterium]MBX9978252.1 STAS domain-containing protein [Mycobacterium gordonae]MCV7008672.1 STAS domain-containing protein [Mycobacterium gordonae]MDP7707151.1 STAS domain-containing protein [Mycobacterium sp. TY815]MDP7733020.1 STAS domain-containing protein [Mycobacterium sp. TY813]PJE00877.1 MAG: STAS domain-containing protein [Mycobacterium sp.]
MDTHRQPSGLPTARDDSDVSEWVLWFGARGHTKRVQIDAVWSTVAVVTICGEIDAANAEAVGRYLRSVVCVTRPMIVDLTAVTFLGARGMHQLMALDSACGGVGAQWALAANVVLRRLLVRVGAGDHFLPVSGSIGAALEVLLLRAPRSS